MSEDVDGRQTRPANDVGRPDGRPISTSHNGRTWTFAEIIWEAAAAWADELDGWGANEEASQIRQALAWFAADQGLSCSKAPHGETPQDAEA